MAKIGLHIGRRDLSLVKVRRLGRQIYLQRYKIIDIPERLIVTSPVEPNITNENEFKKMLGLLFDSTMIKGGDLSLSISDQSVRIGLLELDFLPPNRRELEGIIRWNMEKTSFHALGDTRLSYQVVKKGSTRSDKKNLLLVSTIKDKILFQYEELISLYRVQPVIVDISSFHLFNLYHDIIFNNSISHRQDFIFLSLIDLTFTIMVFKKGILDFIRIKGFRDHLLSEEENRDIIIDKTIEELKISLAFYGKQHDISQLVDIFIFTGLEYREIYKRIEDELSLKVELLFQKIPPFLKGLSDLKEDEISILIPAIAAVAGR